MANIVRIVDVNTGAAFSPTVRPKLFLHTPPYYDSEETANPLCWPMEKGRKRFHGFKLRVRE